MNTFPSRIDGPALLASLAHLPRTRDGTGIMMLTKQWGDLEHMTLLAPAIAEVELFLCSKAAHVMVNTIPPGAWSGWHSDATPVDELGNKILFNRWHLPLVTNSDAYYGDVDGTRHLLPGLWHGPVRYWEPHQAGNDGNQDRTHLVVSLWP